MNPSTDKFSLERARNYVYEGRLAEAYTLFRRFYDRMPFQPRAEHGENIGAFMRVLLELGKEHELTFYRNEAERVYDRTHSPALGYALACLISYGKEARPKAAVRILQSIVDDPAAVAFHIKAKIMLVVHLSTDDKYVESQAVLDTIVDPEDDMRLCHGVRTWRANIARNLRRFDDADAYIAKVYETCSLESDWYGYLSAKIEEARIATEKGDERRRNRLLRELKKLTRNRRYYTIKVQIDHLERWFESKHDYGTLRLRSIDDTHTIEYEGRELSLEPGTIVDRLLLVLMRRRSIDKAGIVQRVYSREYEPEKDDKKIHYQIYSLRKRLEAIGVPPEIIESRGNGYRLRASVEITGDRV